MYDDILLACDSYISFHSLSLFLSNWGKLDISGTFHANFCSFQIFYELESTDISTPQQLPASGRHVYSFLSLGWGQIDEHRWSNNVVWQKLNHFASHLNNVETCVTKLVTQNLYFGLCQTFQSNKYVRDDVHRNWPITNEQLESQLSSRSCNHGGPLLEIAMGLICRWIQAHERSGMSKT